MCLSDCVSVRLSVSLFIRNTVSSYHQIGQDQYVCILILNIMVFENYLAEDYLYQGSKKSRDLMHGS